MEAEIAETIVDNGAGGFGRIAMTPEGDTQPVTNFAVSMSRVEAQAGTSAELARVSQGDGEAGDRAAV